MIYTKSFPIQFAPIAHPESTVTKGAARFSLLTSRLLRLEYDPTETFENRPSQAFWYREQPLPLFSHTSEGERVEIETEHLLVQYSSCDAGFTLNTLAITLKELGHTWRFGDVDPHNLSGTTRTLDEVDGAITLEPGLISRSGWALYDDSRRLVFDADGWLKARPATQGYQDLYFFGYGSDFNACLREFRQIAGQVPMLPRWALGNWWSRYWAYSDDELLALMDDFKAHQVPLSVCIVDMDWHITDTGNTSSGWTGYTWNRALFPDPKAFVAALHQRGLRTALNLHPAEGIHPHEQSYPAIAEAMGIDPDSAQPVRFDIADPEFTRLYFEQLHHPLEAQGIDFWWLDWQQGTLSKLPGLDPLWWLNHLHFYDHGRDGSKRPFIFSRWGGLGNHRYPIGFSGDTHVTWESLAFQPYFTATAANVGYGWWSHDIGGHMSGIEEPELYTRWIQFGVFSPIMRLHCTNNPFHERRPWGYDPQTEQITRDAMQLRHALIPYLYSMSWRDHHDGLPLVQPMYHPYPHLEQAYHCPDQYLFGSELIVAPYTKPQDPATRLSRQVVWLPDGDWYDFFNSERYSQGWHVVHGALEHIPVFAKAGAILPLGPKTGWGGVDNPATLDIHVFPGADNSFEMYEDDGAADSFCLTPVHNQWSQADWQIQIGPANGATAHLPEQREISLHLRAVNSNARIEVYLNGKPIQLEITYQTETASLRISPVQMKPTDQLDVSVSITVDGSAPDYRLSMLRRLVHAYPMESWAKMRLDTALPELLDAPEQLADFELSLNDAQKRAILEVISGAGMQIMPLRGHSGSEIIIWNNHDHPEMRYRLSAYSLSVQPIRRAEPLPEFAVLHQKDGVLHFVCNTPDRRHFSNAVEWLRSLPRRLKIINGAGIQAVVQLDIGGSDGFQAYFIIQDGQVVPRKGQHKNPHASLQANSTDFLALVNAEAAPLDLFKSGQLQVQGDLDLLMKFYQGIQSLPDQYLADDWRLELDYLDILRFLSAKK